MSAPYTPSDQNQGQQPYYPLTPNQETPQTNNVMNSNSPYNAQDFNNGEITNQRKNAQICIFVFLYIISIFYSINDFLLSDRIDFYLL